MMRFFGWLLSFFEKPCTHQWKPSPSWRKTPRQWWVCEKCGLETNDPRPVGK